MNLVLALTGATGMYAARILLNKSPWPVTLVASDHGRKVCEQECGPFKELEAEADEVCDDDDLTAPIASGSVATAGMVVLPCTANTLGKIAGGVADTLITRSAHCHLKEQRKLVLCVRESPWTQIMTRNAYEVATAGGAIMPISPPFYMLEDRDPKTVSMDDLLNLYVDRVLAVLGRPLAKGWDAVR